jgi:hypothetical protein
MNTKSYFSKNAFFNDIIDEYYQNDPDCRWIKHETPHNYSDVCDIDFHHQNKILDCRIISQIDGVELLGNKKHQYRLMELGKPNSIGDYIPRTYIFNTQTIRNLAPVFKKSRGKFIVKPDNSLCRQGITIITRYNQLYNYINKSVLRGDWILQDYVEHPLLYNNRKFHFRIYALLVRDSKDLKVYIYNKSFMYFANNKYKINTVDNESHLSGESSPDNVKVYPEDFAGYFGDQYLMVINEQFRKIVMNTIEPSAIYLKCSNDRIPGHKAFKLIGYDILIDKYNKCYLAEINVRQISLKYPPPGFRETLYTHLLDTIHYPEKPTEFTMVTTIRNRHIVRKTLASPEQANNKKTQSDPDKDRKERIEHFINKSENQNIKETLKGTLKGKGASNAAKDISDDISDISENDGGDNKSLLSKLLNMDFKNLEKEEKYLVYGTLILIILVIIGVVTTLSKDTFKRVSH